MWNRDALDEKDFIAIQFRDYRETKYPECTPQMLTELVHQEVESYRVAKDGDTGPHADWLANWLGECAWMYFWFGFALNLDPVKLLTHTRQELGAERFERGDTTLESGEKRGIPRSIQVGYLRGL